MKQCVVVTRPIKQSQEFCQQIKDLGFSVFLYPTIKISKGYITENFFEDFKSFDWLIFTSKNGVGFFLERFNELGGDLRELKKKKIGVVGERTKIEVEKNNLSVDFIPLHFTTENLGDEIPVKRGEKVLFLRANIANTTLIKQLEEKGAIVSNIPIYKTELVKNDNKKLEEEVIKNQISFLSFTSPSTVEGFMGSLSKELKRQVLSLKVLSIGPVTTRALKKYGFKKVFTADINTTEGMVQKLKEILGYNG